MHILPCPCDATQMRRLASTEVCVWTPELGELVLTGSVSVSHAVPRLNFSPPTGFLTHPAEKLGMSQSAMLVELINAIH